MHKKTTWLFVAIAVLSVGLMSSIASADEPLRLLFIGNSFTQGGSIPAYVKDIAATAGWASPTAANAAVGGTTLEWHRTNPDTLAWVDQGNWDYVILQEYSTRPTDATIGNANPLKFKQDATWFYDRVKATSPNAKIVLYETWARHEDNTVYPTYYANRDVMQNQLNYHYHDAAENYMPAHVTYPVKDDIILAPCGEGWGANYHDRNLMLHGSDLYHAGTRGYYLNGIIIYSMIYNRSALGLAAKNATVADSFYLQGIADSVTGKTIPGGPDGYFAQPHVAYNAVDLGNGLTGYTFYLYGSQELIGDCNIQLRFEAMDGATIQQQLFYGVVPANSESEANSYDGIGGYEKELDTWIYDYFFTNKKNGPDPITGLNVNGYEADDDHVTLITAGNTLYRGVNIIYLVADGKLRWYGQIQRSVNNYLTSGIALVPEVVTIPGDYNEDGYVDLADYTIWADHFGQTGAGVPGDGNGDEIVDLADYTIWADHFGQGTPPAAN